MRLYQAWSVRSESGIYAGCGAQWLERGWVATRSTVSVTVVNDYHLDFRQPG